MSGIKNKHFLALALVLFPMYLAFTFDHSLWNPDETRDAGIARSMFVDKDFVVPHLNGEAFLEKPPLYYWTCSFVYALTGHVTAGTTRLPAAFYGLLGILFTFLIGQRFFGNRVGFMAGMILGTGSQYFRMSHFALMDTSLMALIAGAFYFYLTEKNFLFIILTVLAFYSKGFVAIALIGLVMGAELLTDHKIKKLAWLLIAGIVLFMALVGPWVYGLWKAGGQEFLKVFFVDNNFHRFVSKTADHGDTKPYLYVFSFLGDFLPWSFLAAAGLWSFFSKEKFWKWDRPTRFIIFWFSLIFIFLSVSSSRRSIYLLPAFPAAALLTAVWLEDILKSQILAGFNKMMMITTFGLFSILGCGIFVADFYSHGAILFPLLGLGIVCYSCFLIWKNFARGQYFYVCVGFLFMAVLSYFSADAIFIHDLERKNSFLPFLNEAKRDMPGCAVAGIDMSEMERGVFSFYLERTIPNLKSKDDLETFIHASGDRKILLLSNKSHLENIKETIKDRFNIIYRYRPNEKTRSYVLITGSNNSL